MEANTANEASNTAEENQVTDAEITEQAEVEQSSEQKPAEDAEENAGEAEAAEIANDEIEQGSVECPESEAMAEASEEKDNSGNEEEKMTEETEADNDEDKCEAKVEDEAAESKDENAKEESDSIEKMDENEKKDESDKVDDADKGEDKDTEKVNYTNLAPWFNEELHRLCKKNQQLYKRAREHKNQTKIWDEFKDHQIEVHQEIRKVKREYQEKKSLSDDDMAKLSTKSASKAKEYGLLDFDVKVITDGRNLKEPEKGSHKREHGGDRGNWVSPQEKRRRDQAMREYYKMYY